jgi:three-Cys-motif partner protein
MTTRRVGSPSPRRPSSLEGRSIDGPTITTAPRDTSSGRGSDNQTKRAEPFRVHPNGGIGTTTPPGPPGGETPKRNAFFEEQRPAAVLKHRILRCYLQVFASKTGSTSAGNRVAYLDGYAGPGVYDNGRPGSPALAAETADTLAHIRDLEGYYVEADEDSYERLCRNLAGSESRIYHGRVEEHLDGILERTEDAPLFAFFDPFGLGIPFDTLVNKVIRRKGGKLSRPITEVLLNFSLPGLRRNAGHLDAVSDDPGYQKARETILARLDGVLGGDWWRTSWEAGDEEREVEIFRGFLARIRAAAPECGYLSVPVSKRWGGPVVYCLVFITTYQGGLWAFNNCLSTAMETYRAFCLEQEGQLDLEPAEARKEKWIREIASNIERIIDNGEAPFRLGGRMRDVYGEAMGSAREMHVRAAVRKLYEEGKTATDPTGQKKLERLMIQPA